MKEAKQTLILPESCKVISAKDISSKERSKYKIYYDGKLLRGVSHIVLVQIKLSNENIAS